MTKTLVRRGKESAYRKIFVAAHGEGPYVCAFCGEEVSAGDDVGHSRHLDIHHSDNDPSNNDLSNLVAAHHGCHLRHHMMGNARTKGRRLSDEERAKVSAFHKGRKNTPEHNAKISAARKAYWAARREATA